MIQIIAEIGVNHDGDVKIAELLIDEAKNAGADVAKFQLWNSDHVYDGDEREQMKRLELTRDELRHLKAWCDSIDIEFMATPDEYDDAVFLKEIGVKRIKIASQNVLNLPLLRQIADLGLPIILSTGASTKSEVEDAVRTLANCGANLTILHCVSAYPAPLQDMNLNVVGYLHGFGYPVGLSDHTFGMTASILALGLGATMFEKHLTHDCRKKGPDHAASLEPRDFGAYVSRLRVAERALGDGVKRVLDCEKTAREKNLRVLKKYAPEVTHVHNPAP